MMTNDPGVLMLASGAGFALGTMFFGGLWWTVRRGIASPRPGWWFPGSLLLRTVLAAAGFWFVSGGDWARLLACLAGFTLARFAAARFAACAAHRETGRAP